MIGCFFGAPRRGEGVLDDAGEGFPRSGSDGRCRSRLPASGSPPPPMTTTRRLRWAGSARKMYLQRRAWRPAFVRREECGLCSLSPPRVVTCRCQPLRTPLLVHTPHPAPLGCPLTRQASCGAVFWCVCSFWLLTCPPPQSLTQHFQKVHRGKLHCEPSVAGQFAQLHSTQETRAGCCRQRQQQPKPG